MTDQKLVEWVKTKKNEGYSSQQIYDQLIKQGYQSNEAYGAINSINQSPSPETKLSSNKPIKSSSNFLITTILIIILLIVISGGIFWFRLSQDKVQGTESIHTYSEKTEELKDEFGQKVGEANIKIEANIEAVTSCGDITCFEEKFLGCKPATLTSKLTNTIIYYYEIIGPIDTFCEIKSKFIANPNPNWIGKEMICKYDNSKKFEVAIQDMSACQGPLYDLMAGK